MLVEYTNHTKAECFSFMRYLREKSTLRIYDKHPKQQSKLNKAFCIRKYYVEIHR